MQSETQSTGIRICFVRRGEPGGRQCFELCDSSDLRQSCGTSPGTIGTRRQPITSTRKSAQKSVAAMLFYCTMAVTRHSEQIAQERWKQWISCLSDTKLKSASS